MSGPNVGKQVLAAAVGSRAAKQATARAKADVRKAAKPFTEPVKKGIHEARKWVDKTFSKVPIAGAIAGLPVDLVDDLTSNILLEKEHKWVKPEFVDKLTEDVKVRKEEAKAANRLAHATHGNPGHKKLVKRKGNRKHRKPKMRPTRLQIVKHAAGKGKFKGMRVKGRKKMRFNNKRLGKSESGYRMKTTEYAFPLTMLGASSQGDEIFSNGILINPHTLNLAELNIEVQRWEYYRIRPIIRVDGAGIDFLDGALIGYFDPDPTDLLPVDAGQRMRVAKAHGGHEIHINKGGSWKPSSKRGETVQFTKWFHCDNSGTTTGADQRLENQYRFRCMVYRKSQSYAGGVGIPTSVALNFTISYEIDFKVRTLDSLAGNSTGIGNATLVYSTGPSFDINDFFGVNSATQGQLDANYHVSSDLYTGRGYVFGNTTSANAVSRIQDGKVNKYVLFASSHTATTLTGGDASPTGVGITSMLAINGGGTNANMKWSLWFVPDTARIATTNLNAASTLAQNRTLAKYGQTTSINTAWTVTFPNFSSAASAATVYFTIWELDEGFGSKIAKMFGPATAEGVAYDKHLKMDALTRPSIAEVTKQVISDSMDKKDELEYWKRKAQDKQMEMKEIKGLGGSVSYTRGGDVASNGTTNQIWKAKYNDLWINEHDPENSEDEDYQLYLAAKAKSEASRMPFKPIPLKIDEDQKSEKGAPRPKVGSQK